ncbi:hypothetical protein FG386_002108 [Cryptosporidium ryanae]|uniref:uncharacterized protein n=1 Tax=Cryptosporidium ryanae TaxID=515981 RepID=UPI00351A49DF|nr:hypothetical protein FG386_002108 [Cryptosporidium ryanae]
MSAGPNADSESFGGGAVKSEANDSETGRSGADEGEAGGGEAVNNEARESGGSALYEVSSPSGRMSGWLLIIKLIKNLSLGRSDAPLLKRFYSSFYFKSDLPRPSLGVDHIEDNTDGFMNKEIPKYDQVGVPIHVPIETKESDFLRSLWVLKYMDRGEALLNSHFPRVKHFKKKLAVITHEPYQRVMSFAIDVCMIPSIWYLELVHCMYIGVIPMLTGTTFSYTLQDILGSALMSMGYKDESFVMENCYFAVSLIVDDQLSPNYEQICKTVRSCLDSNSFGTRFKEQKKEFEERIDNIYGSLAKKSGFMDPGSFYRYSLLLSISFLKMDNKNLKRYPERNFLPVRIALTALGYYLISERYDWKFGSEKQVAYFFIELVINMLFGTTTARLRKCRERLYDFMPGLRPLESFLLIIFCKEIFSAGFIDDNIYKIGDDLRKFGNAIVPLRVLDPVYPSLIPNMREDLALSQYDRAWIDAELDVVSLPTIPSTAFSLQKTYKSKQLKRTARCDHYKTGVKPSTCRLSVRVRGTRKLRTKFKKFAKDHIS